MVSSMALTPDEIAALQVRAQSVGAAVGWDLRFVVANPELVGLIAGPDNVFLLGPSRPSDLAAIDVEITLDALLRGDQVVFTDEDGDPQLGFPRR